MKDTLEILNQMVADGVIKQYAIGGAIGAIYYLEPFETSDVDVFVDLEVDARDLAILEPIYDYLRRAGYEADREFINIEGVLVQFLPSFSPLTDEAIDQANTIEFSHVQTRIMRPEHLVAIMVATGRTKDYLRINMFLRQQAVDIGILRHVLERHHLAEKWETNAYRFES